MLTSEGSIWFRRLVEDCYKISPHIRFVRLNHGFFRIYFREAYVHEAYKEMPLHGYNCTDKDFQFKQKEYVEEREDQAELIRNIKNYVEGYWDAIDRIRTRVWMMENNQEFYEQSVERYKTMVVK